MGIQVIGDKFYVSERDGLTELSPDTNGDGLMEQTSRARRGPTAATSTSSPSA